MSTAGKLDPAVAEALDPFRIRSLPPNFYYIPNFISKEEETSILNKIPSQRWITLSHRRLQAHPSTLSKTNTLLGAPLPQYLISPIMERFNQIKIFEHTPHKQPNHVLINEYRRGEGIMPHEDGDAYAGIVATVSLGSAGCLDITWKSNGDAQEDKEKGKEGGEKEEEVEEKDKYKVPIRILYEPRSLLITTGLAYSCLLHGIAPVEVDENLNVETVANWDLLGDKAIYEEKGGRSARGTRISLTYRDVLNVSNAASKVFGGLGRR